MKSIITLIIFILASNQIGISQWEDRSISTSDPVQSVDFWNEDLGFVIVADKIYKTTDGAENWEVSYDHPTSLLLRDITFVEEEVLIAVGFDFNMNSNIVLKSTDLGENWNLVSSISNFILNSLFFTSSTTGFVCGSSGMLYKTVDAGSSWNQIVTDTGLTLNSVHFVNDSVGVIVGGQPLNSIILKTINGGDEWNPIEPPTNDYLQSVYFVTEQTGYAVGWNGVIIKTEDCGSTWNVQNPVEMVGNIKVFFTDELTGYVAGGQMDVTSIQKTIDAGETWEDISPEYSIGLMDLYFPSFDIGYVVGIGGLVLKTENGGVILSTSNLKSNESVSLYPNPAWNQVYVEVENEKKIQKIEIYDHKGQLIKTNSMNISSFNLDVSNLQSGIYYLNILSSNDSTLKQLVVK
ncbi:MAG: YCF48-related protein [Bacteroidota bacterium]